MGRLEQGTFLNSESLLSPFVCGWGGIFNINGVAKPTSFVKKKADWLCEKGELTGFFRCMTGFLQSGDP